MTVRAGVERAMTAIRRSADCPVAHWPSQCHLPRSPLCWPAKPVRRISRHGSAGTRLCRGRGVRSDRLDGLRHQLARHADGRAWQRLPRVPHGRPQPAPGRRSLAGRRRALLRLRGGGRGGARCAGGTAGAARHPGAARAGGAGGPALRARADQLRRSGRQPAGGVLGCGGGRRTVPSGAFDLRLPHRPAGHGPRRVPCEEHRRSARVLSRCAGLRRERLYPDAVPRLFPARQSAAPHRGADRDRAGRTCIT